MTQALAEQAVEVASNISHLLEGAEETSQLLHDISQLERFGFFLHSGFQSSHGKARTLRDICEFVRSETQQNPLLSAKDLCVRYLSLDGQLKGLLKPFEVLHQCVRSLLSCSDRVLFSKPLRNLLYYVVSVPFRRTMALYVLLLYVPLTLLKSHSGISESTGRRCGRN